LAAIALETQQQQGQIEPAPFPAGHEQPAELAASQAGSDEYPWFPGGAREAGEKVEHGPDGRKAVNRENEPGCHSSMPAVYFDCLC